jgi:DNA-directed RNA polymerase subunit M/transcription elongation factor TFIIS
MYYIRLDGEDSNNLIYYCRKCGHEDDTLISTLNNICVSKTTIKKKEGGVKNLVNEYTKLDPTLPRVTNIPCPNAACVSNKPPEEGAEAVPHEVIYLRYNDAQLKFVYICGLCDTVWKSAETN